MNRSSLGETAGHDLRRSALLFELYTEPVLHSEDNMFPRDPMGLQRGYNEDIQPWHAMVEVQVVVRMFYQMGAGCKSVSHPLDIFFTNLRRNNNMFIKSAIDHNMSQLNAIQTRIC